MTDALDQHVAALRETSVAYASRHHVITEPAWPNGARMAVNVTADFDAMLLRRLLNEPASQLAKGEFGGRVGIWRLIELFDSHGIGATIFTPGRICELYPQAVLAASRSGHEIADHMWEHRVPGDTPDHRPCYIDDEPGPGTLLNLPFHFAIDDAMYFSFAWMNTENQAQRMTDCDQVFEIFWAAFWQQYQQGGYLNICLHPFVSGRSMRIDMLDRLFSRMKKLPGVWFATCEDVARHCLQRSPPQAAGSG